MQVRRAGVIVYKQNPLRILLANQTKHGYLMGFGDFGGKLEDSEIAIDAAIREAAEESNGVLNTDVVRSKLDEGFHLFLQRNKSKLYFLDIGQDFDESVERFGLVEVGLGYPTQYRWFTKTDYDQAYEQHLTHKSMPPWHYYERNIANKSNEVVK